MIKNSEYNKIKLLHELSSISWFIDKYGINDAKDCHDIEAISLLKTIKQDLENHIEKLNALINS